MKAGSKAQGAWGQSLLAVVMLVGTAFGQTATDLGEGLRAELTTTAGVTAIKWWGKAGRTYFVQSSQTLESGSWQYMPVVEAGTEGVCTWNLQTSTSKMFVRLVYTDQLYAGAAGAADFDGDGLSNALEVSTTGPHTDPFLVDSDWDGSSDGAELTAGTSPTSSQSDPGGSATASVPLNPDSTYRHGIRLDYSRKGMWAEYYGLVKTPQPPESHHTYTGVYTSNTAGTTFVYGPLNDYTADKTATALEKWSSTAFPTPDFTLFNATAGLRWMDSYWVEQSTMNSSGRTITKETDRTMFLVKAAASPGAPPWARRSVAVIDFFNGLTTNDIRQEGRVIFSASNAQPSDGIRAHVSTGPEAGSAVITAKVAANEAHSIHLMDVDIEPAANMAGTIGDVVPSVQGEKSFVRHFVTPKKTTELPQDYVELTAGNLSAAKFDEFFEWDCDGGQQGADKRTWKVSRATAAVARLKIKTKKTKVVVSEMHVWVVWCDPPTVTAGAAQFVQVDEPILDPLTGQPTGFTRNVASGYLSTTGRKFKYTIKPAKIWDQQEPERPDLEGLKMTGVPGGNNNYSFYPSKKADHALNKWDVSRQMQVRVRNPDGVLKSRLEQNWPVAFCTNQPTTANQSMPDDVPVPFPTNPVEGNDDPDLSPPDEDTNPYQAFTGADLQHGAGELSSIDLPNLYVLKVWGQADYHLGLELNFREFCRLEITDGAGTPGTTWFRISDYHDWHFYLHADFDGSNGQWRNGSPPSSTGANHLLP